MAHSINQATLCCNKSGSGLRVKKLFAMNDAFILKLAWKLKTNDGSLWYTVFHEKYSKDCDWRRDAIAKSCDSNLWKNVVRHWPTLNNMKRWQIGDGETIKFWSDVWGSRYNLLIEDILVSKAGLTLGLSITLLNMIWNWRNRAIFKVDYMKPKFRGGCGVVILDDDWWCGALRGVLIPKLGSREPLRGFD
ncbi:ribonuclease H [Senna tora]|uniref:Ribonuclease H n=1 Tax=Senna tora TaxID=362788 RepID=A0A834XBQ5_9FABA|nr:ribonuclease H [Senna tora]